MKLVVIRFLALWLVAYSLSAVSNAAVESPEGAERPNVVWIMSEDNSKHYLKLFDETGAETPNIKALADEGVMFRRAFSNAPVCSVARTTLITGCYAPRLGTHFHRRIKMASLPEGWELFPALLRDAGYYTTNNAKEDYNVVKQRDEWDASSRNAHWRNRAEDQPFFHVQTFGDSHESSLHFKQAWADNPDVKTDPKSVTVAPYHPDTELFRLTLAHYHDRIQVIDRKVGKVIDELKQAGEFENTIIFYFGDHGGVLPRGKGYIYETGLHVPLVVRVPEKWKHLCPFGKGTSTDGFVEFIDFGPTVLKLAGVDVPAWMDGEPFLGEGITKASVERRDSTLGYADRMDEKYDQCRSLRVGNWKYIRNFQAIYPDGLQNNYRYEMLAYRQWRKKFQANELTEVQAAFFQPKPVEQLFDLSKDPHEVNNLAADPTQRSRLLQMRKSLRQKLVEINDLGMFPESELVDSIPNPFVKSGEAAATQIAKYMDIADLAFAFQDARGSADAIKQLGQHLRSDDALERYWALTTCAIVGEKAAPLVPKAIEIMEGNSQEADRIRAAEFVGVIKAKDPLPALRSMIAESKSSTFNLMALQSVVLFRDGVFEFDDAIDSQTIAARDAQTLRRIGYLDGLSNEKMRAMVKAQQQAERKKKKRSNQ